jgi:hypothetical protein
MKVYKSIKDDNTGAVSAVLIFIGFRNSDVSDITAEMINSALQAVTKLNGIETITQEDRDIQKNFFDNMLMKVQQ